ncbi:GNAT family N-acetyltransferase [Rhodococcus fascians]|uniref:GNAT family N-acetyltransferase n=1 Tax=Rhodococcoides fascians TaxID=1828 RepID=UPI001C5E2493|nr:GNAT family N-acetyltransferase [Rhodococcus fascians]MBW4781972.1 GNAT family N-acetyltransferase [Rhodococcus fascians]
MKADAPPIRALTIEQIDDAEQYSALLEALDSQLSLRDLQFVNRPWLTPATVIAEKRSLQKSIAIAVRQGMDSTTALGTAYEVVVGARGDDYVAFLAGSIRRKSGHAIVAVMGRLESARGLGAGQVLLDAFVEIARVQGCTHIRAKLDSEPAGLEHRQQRATKYGFGPCSENPGFICKAI